MRRTLLTIFKQIIGFVRREKREAVLQGGAAQESGMFSSSAPAGSGPITILGLLSREQDRGLLEDLCRRNGWELVFANTCDEARADLNRLRPQIVLCDRDLPGEDWKDAVQTLASASDRACIILVSKAADDYLWNEVVHCGGYEVLSKPLREDKVIRAVKLASAFWEQHQIIKR